MTQNAQEINPVHASIAWLVDMGFTEQEARNLCKAIRADSPEKLMRHAGAWLEWCGKIKREHDCIVMLAASGMLRVSFGDGGAPDDMRVELAT